jgi:TolB-like protein/DNA-binding winged helix-turn-helix (wHTH) protein
MPREHFYEFGPFRIDPTKRLLLRDGESVTLPPKAFDTLLMLVERHGEVLGKDELMKTLWPDSFVEEANLTVHISNLRKALGEHRHQHEYIVTVHGRGYRFVAGVRELPYEGADLLVEHTRTQIVIEEEEGIGSEETESAKSHAAPHGSVSRPSRVVGLAVACAAVALAATTVVLYRLRTPSVESRPTPVRSVAVLPLKNLAGDSAQDYFSDGMTESLIMALSKIEGLKVISRASVYHFQGREVDPREAGRLLGVEAVLEGSVRKGADSVRVAVRLVSTGDGRVLWAGDTHDRALGDVFALQDEIARGMAAGLKVQLTDEGERKLGRRYTGDLKAYELYLKGRFFWNKRTEEGLQKSIEHFEQAIARDPRYALAYAGLADSYAVFNLYSSAQLKDASPRAKAAAERALALDDTLAEAHATLGIVKQQYDWDWPEAEREYRRAIELDPNYATAYQYYAEYLALLGRTEESVAHIRRAHELSPLSLIINTELGYPYFCARRWDEALEYYRRTLEMDSGFHLALYFAARCHLHKGEFGEAVAASRRAVALSGGSSLTLGWLGYVHAATGERTQAREVLRELTNRSEQRHVSPYLIATLYAGLGENDHAFAWLEKAYEERDYLLVLLRVDPRLDSLREDERFTSLLGRVGLSP